MLEWALCMWLAVSLSFLLTALVCPSVPQDTDPAPILLPVEILGSDGTVATRTFTLDSRQSAAALSLYLNVHGLRYAQQASLQWNDGPCVPLNQSQYRRPFTVPRPDHAPRGTDRQLRSRPAGSESRPPLESSLPAGTRP